MLRSRTRYQQFTPALVTAAAWFVVAAVPARREWKYGAAWTSLPPGWR